MITFELIKAVTHPAALTRWMERCIGDAALCGGLVYPLAADRILVSTLIGTDQAFAELKVPTDSQMIAVHAASQCIAAWTKNGLTIQGADGATLVQSNLYPSRGAPRALAFDASGSLLYISFERALSEGRVPHDIVAFHSKTLVEIASATIYADVEAGHLISIHPSEPVIGLFVGCGQDGTWTYLFKLEAQALIEWAQIQPNDDIAPVIVFSPCGKFFADLCDSRIRLWEMPALKLLAEVEANEAQYFGYNIGFWKNRLVNLANDEEGGTRIQLRSLSDLRVIEESDLALEQSGYHVILNNAYLCSRYTTHKKRISPADCTSESATFQLWKVALSHGC